MLIYVISNSLIIDLKKINKKLLDKIQKECYRIVYRKIDDIYLLSDLEVEENIIEGICEKVDYNRNINNYFIKGSCEEVGFEGSLSEILKLNNRISLIDKIQEKVKGIEKGNVIKYKKIDIIKNLLRYFVSDKIFEYKICYWFLVECILCYYIEYVGREIVLMEGFEEV